MSEEKFKSGDRVRRKDREPFMKGVNVATVRGCSLLYGLNRGKLSATIVCKLSILTAAKNYTEGKVLQSYIEKHPVKIEDLL